MKIHYSFEHILSLIDSIDPVQYGKSRNFLDGAVTRLSPYVSRGVISTKFIYDRVKSKGFPLKESEQFIKELAWRDYWQEVWKSKREEIDVDLKNKQVCEIEGIPEAILNGSTGIKVIDQAISDFYKAGYLHNHVRMYIASVCCNFAKCHWNIPARWMYYHLLDGDWASNALSWQWVAGSFSSKLYFFNQENVNYYSKSFQKNTFADHSYDDFPLDEIPAELKNIIKPILHTQLPETILPELNSSLPLLIYNFYNLDPLWKKDLDCNRVLLLEPSVFQKYPVSNNVIDHVVQLSGMIKGIKIFTGEFSELINFYKGSEVYFKEHPLNIYKGIKEERETIFNVHGYFPSFFSFWKKCEKQLNDRSIANAIF